MAVGLLAAGLWTPAVAALGGLTNAGSDAFLALPSTFTMAQPAQGSRILAADGSVIATPQDEDRVVVPLSEVAPVMRTAQVAIEDSRFYDHGAIDPQGLARAVLEDLRTGQASEGASTLTQQFVKLSLQAQALRDGQTAAARAAIAKTIPRKLEDLRYAVALERSWSKDEILQGYLDLAYYGDGAYGVEAAARHYFDVHASALTLTEAATLAGLVQSPSTTDPAHHLQAAQARRNVVLARMRALDELTPRQYAAAVARPLSRDLHDASLRQVAPERNSLGVAAAAFVTEPGTGAVLGLGQDTAYGSGPGATEVDYAVDRRYGGSGGFQFGSTAKAFALVTAMKQGLGTHASVDAPAADNHRPATFSAKQFPPPCGVGGTWSVYNDEPWKGGSMSLRQATAQSTNTAFVALASRIGVCAIHSTMTAFGIHGGDGQPLGTYPPQVVLGAQAVSPQTMAEAYAGLADHGTRCDVHPVTSVVQGGRTLWAPPPDCRRVADPRAVDQATQYLEYNMTHGSGTLNQLPGRPSAGKTGTSDGNAQSWFVGYTPQLATAVWVGNPVNPTRRMFDVSMAGKSCTSMTGACYAAPIWRRIMDGVLSGQPVEPMP